MTTVKSTKISLAKKRKYGITYRTDTLDIRGRLSSSEFRVHFGTPPTIVYVFFASGKLSIIRHFENQLMTYEVKYDSETGNKRRKFPTKGNTYKFWDKNGRLTMEQQLGEQSRPDGLTLSYDKQGKTHKRYFIRGVFVPHWMYKKCQEKTLTLDDLFNERDNWNIERRRIYLEEYGYARLLKKLPHTVVDKFGEYSLIRFLIVHGHNKAPYQVVRVKDTSTGTYYCLRVPPEINTVKSAVAWTFNTPVRQYWKDLKAEA